MDLRYITGKLYFIKTTKISLFKARDLSLVFTVQHTKRAVLDG